MPAARTYYWGMFAPVAIQGPVKTTVSCFPSPGLKSVPPPEPESVKETVLKVLTPPSVTLVFAGFADYVLPLVKSLAQQAEILLLVKRRSYNNEITSLNRGLIRDRRPGRY
jgi:hypothetical protein